MDLNLQESDIILDDDQVERFQKAEAFKQEGNVHFGASRYEEAAIAYEAGIAELNSEDEHPVKALLYSNLSAARLRLGQNELAKEAATRALDLDEAAVKARHRRMQACAALGGVDDLRIAVDDGSRLAELPDGPVSGVGPMLERLKRDLAAAEQKQAEQALGQLKDLGNSVLGYFGLSLDNFQAQKDPETGNYSLSFNQGGSK